MHFHVFCCVCALSPSPDYFGYMRSHKLIMQHPTHTNNSNTNKRIRKFEWAQKKNHQQLTETSTSATAKLYTQNSLCRQPSKWQTVYISSALSSCLSKLFAKMFCSWPCVLIFLSFFAFSTFSSNWRYHFIPMSFTLRKCLSLADGSSNCMAVHGAAGHLLFSP